MEINYEAVITKLQSYECSTHHQKPVVKLVNGKLNINACCNQFHNQLEKILDKEIRNQIDDNVGDIFGSMTSGII